MSQIEMEYIQQIIRHVIRMWICHFVINNEQARRVEFTDSAFFDGFIKTEISLKRNLYKINSCNAGKIEVMLLRDKGNFKAGEKIIFIRHPWFPRMKNDEDEIIARRLFSLDRQKLMTFLRTPPFRNFSAMLTKNNLVLTCIGRERLILSRKQ